MARKKDRRFGEISPDSVVRTSNVLLHESFSLTAEQLKLVYIVASQVRLDDDDMPGYQFNAGALLDILGTNDRSGKAYQWLKEITGSLRSKPIDFVEQGSYIQTTWMAAVKYDDDGIVTFWISDILKQHYIGLTKVGNFTAQRLGIVCSLRSEYSIRFHALFWGRAFTAGEDGSWVVRMTVDEVRVLFLLKEPSYVGPGTARTVTAMVVKPAIKEINEKTELHVDMAPIKEKITTVGYHFRIYRKEEGVKAASDTFDLEVQELERRLSGDLLEEFNKRLEEINAKEHSGDFVRYLEISRVVNEFQAKAAAKTA